MQRLPTVTAAFFQDGAYRLTAGAAHVAVPALLQLLTTRGLDLARLTTRHASLEDVFVKLTGRSLRDDKD